MFLLSIIGQARTGAESWVSTSSVLVSVLVIVFTSEHLGVEHSHGQWCRIMRISYFGIKTNEYKTKEKKIDIL